MDKGVLAVFAPAADHIKAAIHALQQERNIVRIVLQVGIQRNHDFAFGLMHAGAHGGRLAEVTTKPDQSQVRHADRLFL